MKRILVLTDFSERSEHAAELAVRIAEKTNSHILLYHAFFVPDLVPTMPGGLPYYEDYSSIQKETTGKLNNFFEKLTDKIRRHEPDFRIPPTEQITEAGSVGANIKNFLKHKRNIWLIIMWQKIKTDDGIDHLFFGSDINETIEKATEPILLVPEKIRLKAIKTIAYATDLARTDYKALHMLCDLAAIFDAKILVAHVSPEKLTVSEKLKNVDLFYRMKARLGYENMSYEDIIGPDVAAVLSKFARTEKLEILAMTHRKHTFLDRLMHYSTTQKVIEHNRISLLVFPPDFR